MATEKTLNTRITQKHDISTNWKKATNFKPLAGEIIVYDDLKKIKIGDGKTLVNNLPFTNAENAESILDSNSGAELNIRYDGNGINSSQWFSAWTNENGKMTLAPINASNLKAAVSLNNVDNTADNQKSVKYADTAGSMSEANLQWGGKNFSDSFGCIDAAMIPDLGANRFALLAPAGIQIKYSRNNGKTWTDYGATDLQKLSLFGTGNTSFVCGKIDGKKESKNIQNKLQIIIDTSQAHIYTELNKFCIYCGTNGSSSCYCTIDTALQASPEKFQTIAEKININGWSGYNIINVPQFRTYGNQASSQYGRIRFTFGYDNFFSDNTYDGLTIYRILGFGGVGWSTPSNLAKDGHLYRYDDSQNAFFPGGISAEGSLTTSGNISSSGSISSAKIISSDAYHSVGRNNASITLDKVGNGSYGIGSNGQQMTVQYGQVENLENGKWSSSQNIIHEFKGTLKNNNKSVIVEGDPRLTDSRPASDVPAWAKKPSLDVNDLPASIKYTAKKDQGLKLNSDNSFEIDNTLTFILDGGDSISSQTIAYASSAEF